MNFGLNLTELIEDLRKEIQSNSKITLSDQVFFPFKILKVVVLKLLIIPFYKRFDSYAKPLNSWVETQKPILRRFFCEKLNDISKISINLLRMTV